VPLVGDSQSRTALLPLFTILSLSRVRGSRPVFRIPLPPTGFSCVFPYEMGITKRTKYQADEVSLIFSYKTYSSINFLALHLIFCSKRKRKIRLI
jgi:hypothetical protein